MIEVAQVHWLLSDPPDSWRGAGGLPVSEESPPGVEAWPDEDSQPLPHVLHVTRTPPQGRVLKAVVLSDHLQGGWCHWDGDGVRLCQSPAGTCRFCKGGSLPYALGWLVIQRPAQYAELFELPASVVQRAPYLLRRDARLRGRSITAVRRKGGRNGPVTLVLGDPVSQGDDLDLLPPPVDCRPAVCRLYG